MRQLQQVHRDDEDTVIRRSIRETARVSLATTSPDSVCDGRWLQVVAVATALGCHGLDAAHDLPSSQAARSQRLCPFPAPANEPELRTAQWSLGCDALRQSAPRSIGGVAIWYADTGTAPQRKACLPGYSLAPSPDGKRVYAAGAAGLHVVDVRSSHPRPQKLQLSMAPGWRLSALLAFERGDPGTILALLRRLDDRSDVALSLIDIDGNRATARRLRTGEVDWSVATFFSRFIVPRCADGPERCLVVHRRGSEADVVLVESSRGHMTDESMELPVEAGLKLLDAAWAAPDRQTVILLARDAGCS